MRRMVRTVKDNPQTTSKDLQHHLAADGVTVHRSTIKRTLPKEKLHRRVMQKRPFVHIHHKKSHLRYAKAHLDSQLHFGTRCCGLIKQRLSYVVITVGVMHGSKITQHYKKKHLLPTVKFGGGPSCWGCVASAGTGILENNVQESVTKWCRGWIFQQDNDSKHCSNCSGIHVEEQVQCSWMAIPVPRPECHWKSVGFEAGWPCSATIKPNWTGDVL